MEKSITEKFKELDKNEILQLLGSVARESKAKGNAVMYKRIVGGISNEDLGDHLIEIGELGSAWVRKLDTAASEQDQRRIMTIILALLADGLRLATFMSAGESIG